MLENFFYPYVSLLYGGAWNVRQSLDGLGILSSDLLGRDTGGQLLTSNWAPGEAVILILVLLLIAAIFLAICVITVGYVLARKKGAFVAAIVLLLPGILGMAGMWPNISFAPDTYVIGGDGVLGSGWGMLSLVLLGVSIGWCAMLIVVDLFHAGERFWHAYDHVWYAAGLLAGIFFVADSQVNEHVRRLQESSRESQQASAYLLKQAAKYDQNCRQNKLANTASCRWASDVQQTLLNYSTEDVSIFKEFGPMSSTDVYASLGTRATDDDVVAIRTEIASYNRVLCPVRELGHGMQQETRPSADCQRTPSAFCRSLPDPLNGKIDEYGAFGTTAFASECVVPTLVMLRKEQELLAEKVKKDRRAKHYRWLYYILFSIVAGGKVANATVKLASMNLRSIQESRRSMHLVRRVATLTWRLVRRIVRFTVWGVRAIYNTCRKALACGYCAFYSLRHHITT